MWCSVYIDKQGGRLDAMTPLDITHPLHAPLTVLSTSKRQVDKKQNFRWFGLMIVYTGKVRDLLLLLWCGQQPFKLYTSIPSQNMIAITIMLNSS